MRTEEGWASSADGHPVFWRAHAPDGAPRAVVLNVHGLAEHSGRYAEWMEVLAGHGFAAHALDYRGHGRSPGPRVHIEDVDQWVEDVRAVARRASASHPSAPLFVLGHSQGGLIVLRLALRFPEGLAGIVVTSPFLATHPVSLPPAARRAIARLLMRVAPRLRVDSGLDAGWISRDPAVVARYVADPLVSHKVSTGWLRAVKAAQRAVRADAGSLAVPALVMVAGADRLVDPEVTRQFVSLTPHGRIDFYAWDGLYHEILNEPERQQVYERILQWLDARVAAQRATVNS